MKQATGRHIAKRTWMAGLGLLLCVSAAAQTASTGNAGAVAAAHPHVVVPLSSGSCPVVHYGEWISIDWNPGFDHAAMVTTLRRFMLTFAALDTDGVAIRSRKAFILGNGSTGAIRFTPSVNGFFHAEFAINRNYVPLGEYHLIAAAAAPQMDPEFTGERPTMTVSPVREHFCITVAAASASGS